jgi:hypothetical protein
MKERKKERKKSTQQIIPGITDTVLPFIATDTEFLSSGDPLERKALDEGKPDLSTSAGGIWFVTTSNEGPALLPAFSGLCDCDGGCKRPNRLLTSVEPERLMRFFNR